MYCGCLSVFRLFSTLITHQVAIFVIVKYIDIYGEKGSIEIIKLAMSNYA